MGIKNDAQSIYGFQGADPKQFHSFVLPNIVDYEMAYNRRSTNQIIDILNRVRVDIKQNKFRNEDGEKPILIVGEMIASLRQAKKISNNEPSWDLRLFTSVPRRSKQWKTIYRTRTCSERINNRILNDYRIHSLRIHGKKRYSFMTMIAGINIHLDARLKVSGFSILNLLE